MIDYTYLTITPTHTGGSYVLRIAIAERGAGYWAAWIESLPQCATWGLSRDEAVARMHDAAQASVEMLQSSGVLVQLDTTSEVMPVIDVTEE